MNRGVRRVPASAATHFVNVLADHRRQSPETEKRRGADASREPPRFAKLALEASSIPCTRGLVTKLGCGQCVGAAGTAKVILSETFCRQIFGGSRQTGGHARGVAARAGEKKRAVEMQTPAPHGTRDPKTPKTHVRTPQSPRNFPTTSNGDIGTSERDLRPRSSTPSFTRTDAPPTPLVHAHLAHDPRPASRSW